MSDQKNPTWSKTQICSKLIEQLKISVVPRILESATSTLDSYEVDPEFNDNMSIGTWNWRNLFNRLRRELPGGEWNIDDSNNDLRINHTLYDPGKVFRIHRCLGDVRMPTCGMSSRRTAAVSSDLYLGDNIKDIIIRLSKRKDFVITYDVDPYNGPGDITVVLLVGSTPSKMKEIVVETLYSAPKIDSLPERHSAEPVDTQDHQLDRVASTNLIKKNKKKNE